jgi:hypothetical protein
MRPNIAPPFLLFHLFHHVDLLCVRGEVSTCINNSIVPVLSSVDSSGALSQSLPVYSNLQAAYAAVPNNTHDLFRQAIKSAGLSSILTDNTTSGTIFIPSDSVSRHALISFVSRSTVQAGLQQSTAQYIFAYILQSRMLALCSVQLPTMETLATDTSIAGQLVAHAESPGRL